MEFWKWANGSTGQVHNDPTWGYKNEGTWVGNINTINFNETFNQTNYPFQSLDQEREYYLEQINEARHTMKSIDVKGYQRDIEISKISMIKR